jgi:hypothetical protein
MLLRVLLLLALGAGAAPPAAVSAGEGVCVSVSLTGPREAVVGQCVTDVPTVCRTNGGDVGAITVVVSLCAV